MEVWALSVISSSLISYKLYKRKQYIWSEKKMQDLHILIPVAEDIKS